MSWLDLIIVGLAVLAAVGGYRLGFLARVVVVDRPRPRLVCGRPVPVADRERSGPGQPGQPADGGRGRPDRRRLRGSGVGAGPRRPALRGAPARFAPVDRPGHRRLPGNRRHPRGRVDPGPVDGRRARVARPLGPDLLHRPMGRHPFPPAAGHRGHLAPPGRLRLVPGGLRRPARRRVARPAAAVVGPQSGGAGPGDGVDGQGRGAGLRAHPGRQRLRCRRRRDRHQRPRGRRRARRPHRGPAAGQAARARDRRALRPRA